MEPAVLDFVALAKDSDLVQTENDPKAFAAGVLKELDASGDGKIDAGEWKAFIIKMIPAD